MSNTHIDFHDHDLSICDNSVSDSLVNELAENNNMFSIFHVNIQCLANKIEQLSLFLEKYKFDVICLSEHWQNYSNLKMINIIGHSLASQFCRKVHLHGGVAIYLKNNVKVKELDLSDFNRELHSEFCGILVPAIKTIIITLYRSCTGDVNIFLSNLEGLLCKFLANESKLILLGDFNIDFLANTSVMFELKCLFDSFGLTINISDFTRVTTTSSKCIDNIVSNQNDEILDLGVLDPCLSDHKGQFVCVSISKNVAEEYVLIRRYSRKGLLKLRTSLLEIDWSIFYNDKHSINFLSIFLTSVYQQLVTDSFPLKKMTNAHTSVVDWFNDDIRAMRDQLSAVKLISNISKRNEDVATYNLLRKSYRSELTRYKKQAYDQLILTSTNISKACWRVINIERNKTSGIRHTTEISEEIFNNYFVGIAENIIKALPELNDSDILKNMNSFPAPAGSFFLDPVTPQEVYDAIRSMKNTNSCDVHDLNSKIIKETCDIILHPLTSLINLIFSSGIFPNIFKLSRVIPLFKKGDKSLPTNYRPISIISIFSKIIEIILKQRLYAYFENNLILSENQFGFRQGRSTTQAVLRVVSDIVEGFERGIHTVLTTCDLTKAFDCVSHEILLEKLRYYGVRGVTLDLIGSYLENRQQCVSAGNNRSTFKLVKHGVPQGSVLGPLLFIIYINDICYSISPNKCVLFADDTTLISSNRSFELVSQYSRQMLHSATNWFTANKLTLNNDKTQEIIFSLNSGLQQNSTINFLGITLDDRLTWSDHVKSISQKLCSTLFLLRQLTYITNTVTLKTAYFSLFHSVISYGVLIWGNSAHAIKIFRLQKRAIRIIAKVGYREHCRPLFKNLKIMPLPSLYVYVVILEIHKNKSKYPSHSDIHGHDTRFSSLLRPPRYRLTVSQKNSLNISLYNILPDGIKILPYNKFKATLKHFFLTNCFYETKEYIETVGSLQI